MNNNQFNPNFNYSTQIGGTALKFNLTNILYIVAGLFQIIGVILMSDYMTNETIIFNVITSLAFIALGVFKAMGTIPMGAPVAYGTAFFFVLINFFMNVGDAESLGVITALLLVATMVWVGLLYLAKVIKNAGLINLKAYWQVGFYGGIVLAGFYALDFILAITEEGFLEFAPSEWIIFVILTFISNVAISLALGFDTKDISTELNAVQPVVRAPRPVYGAPQQYGQPVAPVQPQYGQPVQPVAPQYAQPVQPVAPQYAQPVQPVAPQYAQPVQPVAPQYGQPVAPQYAQPVQPQYGQPVPPAAPQYGQPVPPAAPQNNYPGQNQ